MNCEHSFGQTNLLFSEVEIGKDFWFDITDSILKDNLDTLRVGSYKKTDKEVATNASIGFQVLTYVPPDVPCMIPWGEGIPLGQWVPHFH